MNNLKRDKQVAVLTALVEGNSVRSTERMFQVHRDTILRLMVRVGAGCARLSNGLMRDLPCRRLQVDEVWGYVFKKQRHLTTADEPNRVGDTWVFVALDAESKIIPSYKVGKRDAATARAFLADLSSRLANRVQLSSDSLASYVEAVEAGFGSGVDYGQIVRSFEAEPIGPGRYSPPRVTSVVRFPVMGQPDPRHICTSHIERSNLSARMSVRRLTRLTNAFSKKLENFEAAMHLWFAYYNLCRVHLSLRVTPAMEAGVTSRLWSISDLLDGAAAN
jgi:IS1 family transposase